MTDADGNVDQPRARSTCRRAYINVTGNISHIVGLSVSRSDITRENERGELALAAAWRSGSSTHSSQTNSRRLDDAGVVGAIRHPADAIPRLRRGTSTATGSRGRCSWSARVTLRRSDAGASFHYNFASNYGDVHVGVYNGENYNQGRGSTIRKSSMIRATVRPLPKRRARAARDPARRSSTTATTTSRTVRDERFIFHVTYEHNYVNAAYEHSRHARPDVGKTRHGRRRRQGLFDLGDAEDAAPNGSSWKRCSRYDHLEPQRLERVRAALTAGNRRDA